MNGVTRAKWSFFILVAVILLACVASLGQTPPAAWHRARTENFLLVGDANEDDLRAMAVRLEHLRIVLGRLVPVLAAEPKSATTFIVFADTAEYRSYKPKRTDGSPDDAVSGYLLNGDTSRYVTLADDRLTDPFHTLAHEFVHLRLRAAFPVASIPPWLDEGLALYFETLDLNGPHGVTVGTAPSHRMSALRNASLLPVADFLSSGPRSIRGDDASRALFYAQAWAAVDSLEQLDAGGQKLPQLLNAVASGQPSADAIMSAYGISAAEMYRRIEKIGDSLSTSSRSIEGLDAPVAVSSASVTIALADAYRGDLLVNLRRENEAEPLLRRSLASQDRPALAAGSLGILLAKKDKFSESARLLETAIAGGSSDYLTNFYYAYSLDRRSADGSGTVSRFPAETAARMRSSLLRAISLEPDFAESYRLLAFLDFVNDENIVEAAALLTHASILKPKDDEVKVLLARVLLRQEKYSEAAAIATPLKTSVDKEVSSAAADVLNTAEQYKTASIDFILQSRSPWEAPIVFLKRSWMTNADVAQVDLDRQINNMNILLGGLRYGEQRLVGRLRGTQCTGGQIVYDVDANGQTSAFVSADFQSVRLAVLLEGSHSYQMDCGVAYPNELAVFTYRPSSDAAKPQLTGIAFVPADFRLKTIGEVVNFRTVVIEGQPDRLDRTEQEKPTPDPKPEARWTKIRPELRSPLANEKRVMGTLDEIQCDENDSVSVIASAGGQKYSLSTGKPRSVRIGWFNPAVSQAQLACGSKPMIDNVLLTFSSAGNELRAIEFVPEGFRPSGG